MAGEITDHDAKSQLRNSLPYCREFFLQIKCSLALTSSQASRLPRSAFQRSWATQRSSARRSSPVFTRSSSPCWSSLSGIEKPGHGFLRQLLFTFQHVGETHLASLSIALGVLAIIIGFEFLAPKFPGGLLAVIGMTAASAFFHWRAHGIQVVGEVPSGLPNVGSPSLP